MPDWLQVLQELERERAKGNAALDVVRRRYLKKLFQHTNRNLIAYYSGFLSKQVQGIEINDEDKNGFMMCIHGMDRSLGLDLMLHTPGGGIAATQSIVDYLRQMFGNDIRAIVPQIAMSGGTMIACCCKKILLSKHSNLGPIDPQLRGWPAHGVIAEFDRACREVKEDSSRAMMWQCIIGKYTPTFLTQCEAAIEWSNAFVQGELERVMFAGEYDSAKKAEEIVKMLSEPGSNPSHGRHIHADECKKMGLKVEMLEDDDKLQDLVLTVHHGYMHVFQNGPTFKAIESQAGKGIFKSESVVAVKR